MFKKKYYTIIMLLLSSSLSAKEIFLRDGTSVSQKKVNRVYNAIIDLYKNHSQDSLRFLIFDLWLAAQPSAKLKLIPEIYFFGTKPEHTNITERLEYAKKLSLCNADGKIDEETASIIRFSIYPAFKAYRFPLWVTVRSPLSWHGWIKNLI